MKQFATAFGISFAAMFPLLNPVGHAPMFYALTRDVSASDRHHQAAKSAAYSLAIGIDLMTKGIRGSFLAAH